MDDGLTLSRSQKEESHTARLIRSATSLFMCFIRCSKTTRNPNSDGSTT